MSGEIHSENDSREIWTVVGICALKFFSSRARHGFLTAFGLFPAILILAVVSAALQAQAIQTELSASFSYMSRSFGEKDKIQSQSITGSVSFFIWEQIAWELGYTNAVFEKKEQQSLLLTTVQRTTQQFSHIYESNLIFVLAPRTAIFQPYLKGGLAYISKKQVVMVDNDLPFEIQPKPGLAPSYGLGARILLTETFMIRLSYDAIRTPVDDNNVVEDQTGRVGLSWLF
jgi:hypothetical protein